MDATFVNTPVMNFNERYFECLIGNRINAMTDADMTISGRDQTERCVRDFTVDYGVVLDEDSNGKMYTFSAGNRASWSNE